jgi:hypothetical protein
MPRFYFHCTDGIDLILDGVGGSARSGAEVRRRAAATARKIMQGLPGYPSWSEWLVSVHDELGGQVAVVSFLDDEEERRRMSPVAANNAGQHA